MESFFVDIRSAWKALFGDHRAYLVAAVAIALAIGVNAVSLSIVRAVLVRPLPYRDPAALVMVWNQNKSVAESQRSLATPDDLVTWRTRARDFVDIAALETWEDNPSAQMDFTGASGAERLRGAYVTPNFFSLLGVSAALGQRSLNADDENERPIVLSHAVWRSLFGADQSIVGREIPLAAGRNRDRRMFRVLGILPAGFHFTYPLETQVWVLRSWREMESAPAGALLYRAIGRLRPDISLDQAQRNMTALAEDLAREFPAQMFRQRTTLRLEPAHEHLTGRVRPLVMLLAAVSAMILLIASVNVAGVLLARTARRARELAVRAALGASRFRLFRQLVVEGILLSVVGGAAGLTLALVVQRTVAAAIPANIPRVGEIRVDWWVTSAIVVALALTSVVSSSAPGWYGARVSLRQTLHEGNIHASGGSRSKLWVNVVVGGQVAVLCVLLLIGALLLHSWSNLRRVELGFDGESILAMEMRLLGPDYQTPEALRRFEQSLLATLRSLPAIQQVSTTSSVPMRGVDWKVRVSRKEDAPSSNTSGITANLRQVDWQYFALMHIPLKKGRLFSETDGPNRPPVAILSESLAKKLFPNEDPIGKYLSGTRPRTIVGIVGDVRHSRVTDPPAPALYVARLQEPSELMCLVMRPTRSDQDVAQIVIRAIRSVNHDQPVERVAPLDRIVEESLADARVYTGGTLFLGSLALVLTTVGLYGVMSHGLTDRFREVSIRMALGASRRQALQKLLFDGLRPVFAGVGVGLLVGYWVAGALSPVFFNIAFNAPFEYCAVAALIIGISALVCYLTTSRASTELALVCLRQE